MINLPDGEDALAFLDDVDGFAFGVALALEGGGESEESSLLPVYTGRFRFAPAADFPEDDAGVSPSLSLFNSEILTFPPMNANISLVTLAFCRMSVCLERTSALSFFTALSSCTHEHFVR